MSEHRDRREERRDTPPEPYSPTYRDGGFPDEVPFEEPFRGGPSVERDEPDDRDREPDR